MTRIQESDDLDPCPKWSKYENVTLLREKIFQLENYEQKNRKRVFSLKCLYFGGKNTLMCQICAYLIWSKYALFIELQKTSNNEPCLSSVRTNLGAQDDARKTDSYSDT